MGKFKTINDCEGSPYYYGTEKETVLYPKVVSACGTIAGNSCSVLKAEVLTIKGLIGNLSLNESWDDVVGDSYAQVITSTTNSLQDIINSIDNDFRRSEELYKKLKQYLDALKQNEDALKEYLKKEPQREQFMTSYQIKDSLGQVIKEGQKFDEDKYNYYHGQWEDVVNGYVDVLQEQKGQIEADEKTLDGINNTGVATDNINALPGINVADLFVLPAILPTTAQMQWILENYLSDLDPRKLRFSQGDYDDVVIKGAKNLHTSGCGFISLASMLSCGLSEAYGKNIVIDPRQLANIVNDKLGHGIKNYFNDEFDYNWNSYDDMTSIFNDVSLIKLKSGTQSFTDETLENVLDAGGAAQVSIAGRASGGHVVSILESNGDGTYRIGDSGNGENVNVGLTDPVWKHGHVDKGYIKGKDAAICMANKNMSINFKTGVVSGINAKGLPVESISICGKTYKAHVEGNNLVIDNPQTLQANISSSQGAVSI